MFLRFESLAFKNILSYGSVMTRVEFTAGMNLLTGKNGQGKSTFLDALSFCLYGRPYRKIRLAELINRRVKRALHTECVFWVGTVKYKIVRSLHPNLLTIFKNDIEQEELSTRDLTQEEIDKIIGIDYYMFRQVISLALNYNKAFLSLSTIEKRAIVESVFNVRIVGDMLRILKKRAAASKIDFEIKSKSTGFLEADIKSTRRRIREISHTIDSFEQDQAREINKLFDALNRRKEELQKSIEIVQLAQQRLEKIGSVDCKRHRDLIALFKQRIEIDRSLLREKEKQEHILTGGVTCPLCHRTITEKHRARELAQIAEYRTKVIGRIAKEESRIEKVQRAIDRLQKLQNSIAKLQQIISHETSRQETLRDLCSNLEQQLAEAQSKKVETVDVSAMKAELDQKVVEFQTIFEDTRRLSKQCHIYDVVGNILSDSGIKAYFFKHLLPILNQKINENLQRFEIPVHLSFNEMMEETLISTETMKDIAYFGCSEGEKKRVDVCVLLAFIDVVKMVCNWNCNLIIFDELFDVHVDEDGLDSILKSLVEMVKDNPRLCVYVISHKLHENTDLFARVLSVQKSEGFSKLINAAPTEGSEEE